MIVFDVIGFGKPMDHVPMLLEPGILTMAWGSVLHQIAAGLGVEIEEIEEFYERRPATETFDIDSGTIDEGTVAGLRFELRGKVDGKDAVVLEHVTRVHDDIAPDWPQPAGQGCYRVVVTGEPNYTIDLQLLGTDGDHNTAGLKATAMRIVNSIPAVVDAKPGLVTALDLPLVTGRGLIA
jgi:4-hydroxy-tetrahydrodipicolinate reductase